MSETTRRVGPTAPAPAAAADRSPAKTPQEAPDQESVELFKSKTGPAGSEGRPLGFDGGPPGRPLGFDGGPPGRPLGFDDGPLGRPGERDDPKASGPKPPDNAPKGPDQDLTDDVSSLLSAALSGSVDPGRPMAGSDPRDLSLAEPAPLGVSVSELAEKILARVLVGADGPAGAEARLTVDPAILADVEIRLSRGLDGFLNVTLISADPNSLQTLAQARGDLERALTRTEGAGFKLSVEDDRADSEGSDREGRSRGLDYLAGS